MRHTIFQPLRSGIRTGCGLALGNGLPLLGRAARKRDRSATLPRQSRTHLLQNEHHDTLSHLNASALCLESVDTCRCRSLLGSDCLATSASCFAMCSACLPPLDVQFHAWIKVLDVPGTHLSSSPFCLITVSLRVLHSLSSPSLQSSVRAGSRSALINDHGIPSPSDYVPFEVTTIR
jgi:hypothetical protein